ncbi:MAG: hypothetical protein ACE5HS_22185 [bacterium]
MNRKRFIFASMIIFVIFELITSLNNVLLFGGVWELGLTIGDLVWSCLFVFIYTRISQEYSLLKGLQYGLLMGVFFSCPVVFGFFPFATITHVDPDISDWILPGIIPSMKAVLWFLLTVTKIGICGLLASVFYRPTK